MSESFRVFDQSGPVARFRNKLEKSRGTCPGHGFFGVKIDCVSRVLSLPDDKLQKLKDLLLTWVGRQKATKKALQSIVGKLNWASRVVLGGRTFMRNLINLIPKARLSHHFVRLSSAARGDMLWWVKALNLFHGFSPFVEDVPLPSFEFATDAYELGGGGPFKSDWFYTSWSEDHPEMVGEHINLLELKTVLEASKRWGDQWAGLHVRVRSDNSATVASLNKGTSRSCGLLALVQEIFWLSVRFGFKISAAHIPGVSNTLADRISRLHSLHEAHDARLLLAGFEPAVVFCKSHMTPESFVLLQDLWRRASTPYPMKWPSTGECPLPSRPRQLIGRT
jgi:hypothetical protein